MSVNIKVTGGLDIEWGQIDTKATGGLRGIGSRVNEEDRRIEEEEEEEEREKDGTVERAGNKSVCKEWKYSSSRAGEKKNLGAFSTPHSTKKPD